MPTEIKLLDRESFAALLSNKPLGDAGVGPALPGAAIASDQTFSGESLSVNVHGDFTLRAFNSPDDADPDGILGEPVKDVAADAIQPQIQLAADAAYVKYRAEAGIKATAGKTLEALGFALKGKVEGEGLVIFADYQRRTRDIVTRDAVLDGLKQLRSSFRLADVLDLKSGEAVSQQVVGRLSASVEVAWSDVFTGAIGPLARLAGSGISVLLKVSAAATFKASVSFSDDFLLVFSKVNDTEWRIGLRKAKTRAAAVGLDLGATVEFADPGQVQEILGSAIEGLIGEPLDKVETILRKSTLQDLSAEQRELADRLIARLGLDRALATLAMIRDKIADIRKKIGDTVKEIATAKVTLGFTYEYQRIRQDTTVLQCRVTAPVLTRHHPDLIKGRLGSLLVEAADKGAAGSVLEHFLYQKTIKTERSWGFSLSIGKWLALGGRDRKALVKVERRSAENQLQLSYVGTRAYRNEDQDKDAWSADLSASMPTFSRAPVPLVSEFQTGVAFNWFEDHDKLNDDTLGAWIDMAVLWGAVSNDEAARQREQLSTSTLKKKCSFVAQLTFPHQAFAIMRTRIAAANVKELGAPLGAAMGFMREAGRDSVVLRRRLYGPLWEFYLSNPDHADRSGRDFAETARQHLAKQGFANLASREQIYGGSTKAGDETVFCGLIDMNPHTMQNCRDFINGVKRLNLDVLSTAPDHGNVERVFEEMENFWRQSHHVRAVGAYLLDVAKATGVLVQVGRSISINVGTDVFVLAS